MTKRKPWEQEPHWRGDDNRAHYFGEMKRRIAEEHPTLIGKHIFEHLAALGLYDEFMRGSTPVGLPYSFSDIDE